MHDDDKAPLVAVVNREFARKVFGSVRRLSVGISSSGVANERKL